MIAPDLLPDEAFARAYHAATRLVAATPELMGFAGWPHAQPAPLAPSPIPAARLVADWAEAGSDPQAALHAAIRAIAPLVRWQQTYTEAEVGRDFLNRYGWFELVGPTGHFRSDEIRAYIAYWGPGLYYPWHLHEAEELYYVIAGSARFEAEGLPPQVLGPGALRFHATNQPHAMTTEEDGILTLVLWRGAGLTGAPRMGRA